MQFFRSSHTFALLGLALIQNLALAPSATAQVLDAATRLLQGKPAIHTAPSTPGFGAPAHGGTPGQYADRADVIAWADAFAANNQLDPNDVLQTLAQARYQLRAAQLMMPARAGVAKDWAAYRDRFVEPIRLQAGLRFWAQHADALQRAEATYGVPAQLIMGIIGVETNYGQIMGNYRVLDALTTLAFDFPGGRSDRSPFFREQLGEFLLLARAEAADPTSFKGSFAGAMGFGQFMPGSWRKHAVDFDGDAHIDLVNNPVDAIGSVAHFLVDHGWKPGMPTHRWADAPTDTLQRAKLLVPDIDPTWSLDDLQAHGMRFNDEQIAALAPHSPWALIELENGPTGDRSYAIGTKNFWVVTRYNRSSYYAMGVIALGERLGQLHAAGRAAEQAAP